MISLTANEREGPDCERGSISIERELYASGLFDRLNPGTVCARPLWHSTNVRLDLLDSERPRASSS